MPPDYLHHHAEFPDLLRIVSEKESIDPALVEKDYWIMHCLYGLQQLGMAFELKGGTSLSKGYGIIHRFSEDIDIRIEPPAGRQVKTGPNHNRPAHRQSRKDFYDWLAETIRIDGIDDVRRDPAFDETPGYRSGGIRLDYRPVSRPLADLKAGILLEVGFDDVTPNEGRNISSWAYAEAARRNVSILDNRATHVACYHPGYTLVEKLQTISTKFRQQQDTGGFPQNFMRHYYDVYCLLHAPNVLEFIGTPEYHAHKEKRFRAADNPVLAENDAFVLRDPATRDAYRRAYEATGALYYQSRPDFDEILRTIQQHFAVL